ncbi:hypothetical protein [Leucobacter sp. L43]|uniref:hypothetical protein n=1 Tax=Leucobacter sp. L43 TaxID=2798040 RepID=UPI001904FE76|nr:hypothetical protein [Leucobacter sp. L43]
MFEQQLRHRLLRQRLRTNTCAVALSVALGLGLAGCSVSSAGTPVGSETTSGSASEPSGPSEPTPAPLAPGATLDATSLGALPDWVADWQVTVITTGDAPSVVVTDAMQRFASEHRFGAEVIVTDDPRTALAQVLDGAADSQSPDLIIGVGPATAGAFDLLSAASLDQQFLMLGTQLAEPTDNVTAAVWPGAEDRAVFADRPPAFSARAAEADAAIRAGITAAATGWSGYVFAVSPDPALTH